MRPTPPPADRPASTTSKAVLGVSVAGLLAAVVVMFWPAASKPSWLIVASAVVAAVFAAVLLATWQSNAMKRR